jgi:transcriptional regulator with XRE-family HTH domain
MPLAARKPREVSSMRLTVVKLCRFERGLLQLELARRADIALRRLSAIENGLAEAQPEELERIAGVLDVPLDALLVEGYDSPSRGVSERSIG